MELHFDEFTLDPLTRQLRRGADEIHVSPKAFALLLELVERRPGALTKAALQESLWPGTFVVEANLSNLVAEVQRWEWIDQFRSNFGDEAAFWITSFGSPQIMDFNFRKCGHSAPSAMAHNRWK